MPDYADTVVTSAKGSGDTGYHATAREASGETVMVWCPNTNQVTVDMTEISGTTARAWWWDPTDNSATLINTYATTGTQNITPSSGQVVLVIDATSAGLAAPGS